MYELSKAKDGGGGGVKGARYSFIIIGPGCYGFFFQQGCKMRPWRRSHKD